MWPGSMSESLLVGASTEVIFFSSESMPSIVVAGYRTGARMSITRVENRNWEESVCSAAHIVLH